MTHLRTEENKNIKNLWYEYGDIAINKSLFKKGIVAIIPQDSIEEYTRNEQLGKERFFIKNRDFSIASLLTPEFNKPLCHLPASRRTSANKVQAIIKEIINFTKTMGSETSLSDVLIFNSAHREEIFSPLIIQDFAAYIYPWISNKQIPFKFQGCNEYVTAGCLFGTSLQGIDRFGACFSIIKHDIEFFPGQKIIGVQYFAHRENCYESVMLKDLEKQLLLIKKLSTPTEPSHLTYHLPYYDYILFGVGLFINGKITLNAFEKLAKIILNKKEELKKKIFELCENNGVRVDIISPFDNLLNISSQEKNISTTILSQLNLSNSGNNPVNECDQKINERDLVQFCLKQLVMNHFVPDQQKVWQEYVQITPSVKINNLEELFKIANSVIVGAVSRNRDNYKVCSLLPISEKQIQVGYSFYSKKLPHLYPSILNITSLESVVSYSLTTKGLLFYCATFDPDLNKLIIDKKLLFYANQNIGFFAGKVSSNQQTNPVNTIAQVLTR